MDFTFTRNKGRVWDHIFLTNLYADIESLRIYGGIHSKPYKDYHRVLAKRFPFAVFYKVEENSVRIYAVLDCRRNPSWIRKKLP